MTLVFVYNANSGKINALLDAGHKLFSPSTYPCSLCALTYDTFTENSTWKSFRKEININMKFYHKDEFESEFPYADISYPTILKLDSEMFSTVIDHKTLDNIPDVASLIQKLKTIL
ncbi:GTPase [Winogradskyella sp.]|uniref:GTPase n=1 Tax=Winogradskyella sp. TaxID=1883156 RepID=UPI00261C111E|nr:GTPase [Winogradskyella sp.]